MRELRTKSDVAFDVVNTTILLLVLAITLFPLIFVVMASFSNPMRVIQGDVWLWPVDFQIRSYQIVFNDPRILRGYANTIMYTVVGTTINLVITTLGAYPLSRRDLAGRNTIMFFFAFTMLFSGGLIPTFLLISNLGMINTFWVMVIPGALSVWNMIIMRTFFTNSIPWEIQEAAKIDGCSNFMILIKIILPLSGPIIAVMVLFYGVSHWNSYFNALIYLNDSSRYPLQLILREILTLNQVGDMLDSIENFEEQLLQAEGIKYALIVVASVPVMILYPFLQRYFVKGVMVGAIKS